MKLAQGFEAAAAVDPAGIESDDLEKRDAGRASSARGVGNGRGQGRGRVKQKAVRLQPHEVRRPSSGRHRGNRATRSASLKTQWIDLPRNLSMWASKGKVVCIATGPCVVFPR